MDYVREQLTKSYGTRELTSLQQLLDHHAVVVFTDPFGRRYVLRTTAIVVPSDGCDALRAWYAPLT